ncbi:MAG: efflux RND transporter permease subunit, partial [Candidatus Methylomirabilis sp.]|nr:efflux RND transporter permease subunit [Deltaproteobacteria bacterium]
AMGRLAAIPEAFVLVFNPPPIRGLGTTGGFELYLQDRAGLGADALAGTAWGLVGAAAAAPELANVTTTFRADAPHLYVDVDRDKAKALGAPISDVFDALQTFLGSLYVNDFNKYGRVWRVQLQAEPEFRASPEDIAKRYVRGFGGRMVPLGTFTTTRFVTGPSVVSRYNNFPAAFVSGAAAPGYSSGQAIAAVERVSAESLPPNYVPAWTGTALQEKLAAGKTGGVLAFGLVMVFLVLAAQYERWSIPLAVMLGVPLSAFGALLAVWLRGMENDIYFQIGLLTLIGLTAKTAILIVEFAAEEHRRGKALLEAARLRFRPILMTAFTFILGVAPLAYS